MKNSRSTGFTLVEIAIVLAGLGLLLSGGLIAVVPLLQGQKTSATEAALASGERDLLAYVITNGCLPCPADPAALTGLQDPSVTACSATCNRVSGVLPWVTVGIPVQAATDSWGRVFTYAVPGDLHVATAMQRSVSSFPDVAAANELIIENLAGTPFTGGAALEADLAYVLLSHGPDQAFGNNSSNGASGADRYTQATTDIGQDENGDDDRVFSQGQTNSAQGATHFDDIVVYRSARNVILTCGAGSCGNPE